MKEFFCDDKNLVILSILIITCCTIFGPNLNEHTVEIIKNFGTGLFGMATGMAIRRGK